MSAELTAKEEAMADRIAARMKAFESPVWNREQVALYTPYKSASAQNRFFAKAKIKPCARGLYSREKIQQALKQLSKKTYRGKEAA